MAKENPNLTILRQLIEDQGTKAGRQGDAALGALGAGVAKVKSTAKFDLLSGKAARESAGLGDRTLSAISGRKGAAGAATKDIPKKLLELLNQKKYKEAIKTLEAAIKKKGHGSDTLYYLGLAYEKSGDRKTAAKHYKEALKFTPDFNIAKKALKRVQ
ncbi:hypothetical protein LCGC14_1246080 [marine sediment metagenome]|uniref:Uncharacterized protein n=1 Tax=marine sediment metagenome TaxID=412755 RepID=A0A0F9L4H0_9ZZZZ